MAFNHPLSMLLRAVSSEERNICCGEVTFGTAEQAGVWLLVPSQPSVNRGSWRDPMFKTADKIVQWVAS